VEEKFDVVIVGGGLAGLTLASALSVGGHPTAVLEARRGVAPVKRGMSLAPNGLQVLDRLDLLSEVEGIGRKVHVVKYLKSSGEVLAAYDYSLLGCRQNYLLAFLPHELESLLRKRAEQKHVKIYEGASFDAFLRESGQVSGVRATIDGRQLNLTAKVVVGADGGRSVVRQAAGIQANSEQYTSSYLVTVADAVDDSQGEAKHYLARGRVLGSFPLPHGKYLFYYLPTGTFENLKTNGLERFKMDLTTLAPELTACLETVNSWNDFSYMIPQEARVDSWVADHVALVGDAAHSIEPSLGQGGSLALSDVDALLQVLDICFAKSDFSATALKSYEAARRSQTELLQRMAELTAMLMNTNNRVVQWLRDRTMRRMQGDQKSMMLALETASGMKGNISLTDKLRLAGFL
jgi:2-polyprenyl-6-methoxyphenol hydroxylase-like FAD-dependent oxidoreductase